MQIEALDSRMQYIERNGCCLNIDEKMKLQIAFSELESDLGHDKFAWSGKITGKHMTFQIAQLSLIICKLLKSICDIGVVKDYFLVMADQKGTPTHFWCSSSSWIFSQLPKPTEDKDTIEKLSQINTLFTGEFDQVLFASSGPSKVIDEDLGLVMQAKPVTELDRLAYVWQQIADHQAFPKGTLKYTPAQKLLVNEAFSGLTIEEAKKIENWQIMRKPTKKEIVDLHARGEAVYNMDGMDCVADDFPKKSWSIQVDATGTVTTLKSHLWPGLFSFHKCNTEMWGCVYMGDGIRNNNLPFMV